MTISYGSCGTDITADFRWLAIKIVFSEQDHHYHTQKIVSASEQSSKKENGFSSPARIVVSAGNRVEIA